MKKSLILLVPFLLSGLLLGCSNGNNNNNNEGSSEEQHSSSEHVETSDETSSEKDSSETSSETHSSEESTVVQVNTPNPDAVEITIDRLIALGNLDAPINGKAFYKTDTLYRVTGYMQYPFNTTYGNFDILDETGSICVWGLCGSTSVMSGSRGNYSFQNDRSYSSIGVHEGYEVTIECLYAAVRKHKNYHIPEISGYIVSYTKHDTNLEGQNYTAKETYNGNYYSSVEGKTGEELKKGLHQLMDTTHTGHISYKKLENAFHESDHMPNSSTIKCFYSGKAVSGLNKEHVWPQSQSRTTTDPKSEQLFGETGAGCDLHHIRPTTSIYNSKRGNSAFGYVYGPKSSSNTVIDYADGGKSYCTGNTFEPADAIKGDVARIIAYVYVHYDERICDDSDNPYYGMLNLHWVLGPSPYNVGKLLRKWNAIDPVSEDELTRNEVAFDKQGNRNPFIDHPTYMDAIWG